MRTPTQRKRCAWSTGDPLTVKYHDAEWGVPVHRDRKLFEMLLLEGAQAGLSWLTVLRKRVNYRRAFKGFDPVVVARYGWSDTSRLLRDEGIIRNRLKIESAVTNAQAFLRVRDEFGTFDSYIWQFTGSRPIVNRRRSLRELPVTTPESDAMSRDLRSRGFRFVGSTICYSFMQAVGMVNDHEVSCFRYRAVHGPGGRRKRRS